MTHLRTLKIWPEGSTSGRVAEWVSLTDGIPTKSNRFIKRSNTARRMKPTLKKTRRIHRSVTATRPQGVPGEGCAQGSHRSNTRCQTLQQFLLQFNVQARQASKTDSKRFIDGFNSVYPIISFPSRVGRVEGFFLFFIYLFVFRRRLTRWFPLTATRLI